MDEHPSWIDRQAHKLSRRVREDPKVASRAERSWFGRLLVRTSRRATEGWQPVLEHGERVEMMRRAERVRLLFGVTPGRLFLTNKRLVFEPIMPMPLFWSAGVEVRRQENVTARKGRFLSRGIHFRPWLMFGHLPGFLHIANLKIRRGWRAYWFYVERPDQMAEAVSSHAH